MRILVADDESLVRYGLISILEDILGKSSSFYEAENGIELIEKARETRPHVAFVDIRMPEKDGLEGIAEARIHSPKTLWVMLTGHADFTYAQKALKLGVVDFMLKPADPEELKALMGRLADKTAERQRRENRELEAKTAAVLGNITSIRYDSFFEKKRIWQACMVIWDSLLPHDEILRRRREFARRLVEALNEENDYSGSVVSLKDGSLLIILAAPAGSMPADRIAPIWKRRFASLRTETGDLTGEGIGDTWLLTRVLRDPDELFREIEVFDEESGLRFLRRGSPMTEYAELARHAGSDRYLKTAAVLQDLKDALALGREADFHGLTHHLEEAVKGIADDGFVLGGPAWFARYAVPLPPPAPTDLAVLARRLHDESHELFAGSSANTAGEAGCGTPGSLVERAVEILKRRYRENIGIGQVAERLGVTPNYLSTVFKKESGMSFTSRLTELRLEKSKELLGIPGANVGEVARSLGYQSGRHFTRLFKERFGKTPSDWMTAARPQNGS